MIKIALPNKGALSEEAVKLVTEAGYKCKRGSSELIVTDVRNKVEFYFLRPRDIAVYVGTGVLELGITGRDLALDSGAVVHEILPLNFGHSSFRYAVPAAGGLTPEQFGGKRIACSYPHIVELDLKKRGIQATVVELDGAVEISIRLGVADVIADVVQSGRTLTEAGLAVTGESLLESEAVLIAHSVAAANLAEAQIFLNRLKGITVARDYQMVEYDIPKTALQQACTITPGIQSPTISPLSHADWVAVKSMIKKNDANAIIDQLAAISAKGIIVTDIRTCRI